MAHFLVIDQGTHASRCMIFNSSGQILAQSERSISIYRQDNGFIEQNAEEILNSIHYCLHELQSQPAFKQLSAAALITQRSTIVGWNKHTGDALSAAISWQDTRASAMLAALQDDAREIKKLSGLVLSAHYGASKIKWLLSHDRRCQQAAQAENIIIAPLASYLIQQLSTLGTPVVDHVNASRTQLFDINSLQWSDSLLDKFQISKRCLPEVRPCLSDYGRLKHHDIPLMLVNGDQNAALFANGDVTPESVYVNIGTGAFALKVTQRLQQHPLLLNGIAFTRPHNTIYLQEGTVNGAGAALQTLASEIDENALFEQLPHWLSELKAPPVFINSISGLGSPWWDSTIEPHYLDLDADNISLPERAVAIVESIVFLLQNNIELLLDASTKSLVISGGLCRLDHLCQKLADLSQLKVSRVDNTEASASGAAWLLSQAHDWQSDTKTSCFTPEPQPLLLQRYQIFTQQLAFLTRHKPD
ncbi:MAG: FGGY family carbohydrate kinase [Gammaproteobacteria bacterium]|nr:FGGY family carbohydrate kinase [Gammaproteobacteria bacterium]